VVRQRSAKPLFVGSTPIRASNTLVRDIRLIEPSGKSNSKYLNGAGTFSPPVRFPHRDESVGLDFRALAEHSRSEALCQKKEAHGTIEYPGKQQWGTDITRNALA
jgi:hypothetical protein